MRSRWKCLHHVDLITCYAHSFYCFEHQIIKKNHMIDSVFESFTSLEFIWPRKIQFFCLVVKKSSVTLNVSIRANVWKFIIFYMRNFFGICLSFEYTDHISIAPFCYMSCFWTHFLLFTHLVYLTVLLHLRVLIHLTSTQWYATNINFDDKYEIDQEIRIQPTSTNSLCYNKVENAI